MRWLACVALVLVASGCSETLAVHVVTQPGFGVLRSRDDGCDAQVYGTDALVPDDCREMGDVFLGDTGFTTNCGRVRVWDELRRQACRFGADAAQIVRDHPEGSYGSSCYQVRARMLSCPSLGETEMDE